MSWVSKLLEEEVCILIVSFFLVSTLCEGFSLV